VGGRMGGGAVGEVLGAGRGTVGSAERSGAGPRLRCRLLHRLRQQTSCRRGPMLRLHQGFQSSNLLCCQPSRRCRRVKGHSAAGAVRA
jgi:hypothetical protein